jgi:hypothetical protein
MNVLSVNLLISTFIFWVAAQIYVLPKLRDLRPRTVMPPILLLHSLRHLGLMFLAPGAVLAGMPRAFAVPAALGDLLASFLALAAIPAVLKEARGSRALVAIFNVVGTADLLTAITLATVHNAAPFMGAAYWIPSFWVPALLVTHAITFLVLRRAWPAHAQRPGGTGILGASRTPGAI